MILRLGDGNLPASPNVLPPALSELTLNTIVRFSEKKG
jgi:hypothetical protein